MLIKRTEREARRGALAAALASHSGGSLDRRAFLRRSGLAAGGLAALGALPLGSVRKAEAGPPPAARRRGRAAQEHLHPLLGRVHGRRRGLERRVDRPGAGLGKPAQPRLALRQGCVGARDRARRPPPALSDEARQRPVDARVVGPGDQRDRRQAHRDSREVRARLGLLARLGEVLQRGRVPQPQARRLLGDQQRRPPGAHLPFDHGRRRSQYLGLRRDDQLLQRHPQLQDHDHHGR